MFGGCWPSFCCCFLLFFFPVNSGRVSNFLFLVFGFSWDGRFMLQFVGRGRMTTTMMVLSHHFPPFSSLFFFVFLALFFSLLFSAVIDGLFLFIYVVVWLVIVLQFICVVGLVKLLCTFGWFVCCSNHDLYNLSFVILPNWFYDCLLLCFLALFFNVAWQAFSFFFSCWMLLGSHGIGIGRIIVSKGVSIMVSLTCGFQFNLSK